MDLKETLYNVTDQGLWWLLVGLVREHPEAVRAQLNELIEFVRDNPDRRSSYFREEA